jgi:hypothetical protein
MTRVFDNDDPGDLTEYLRDVRKVTPAIIREVISLACWRVQVMAASGTRTRIAQLIEAKAWTDVALALIDLELPQWRLRRMVYDGGEWYCALSRQPELPERLDHPIQANHPELPLAILTALINARSTRGSSGKPSVPSVP